MEDDKGVEKGVPEQAVQAAGASSNDVGAITTNDEENANEAPSEEQDATTNAHPKRKRRIIITVAIAVVILIVIILATVLTRDTESSGSEPPDPEYDRILDNLDINVSSSDSQLEHAMGALVDYFLSTCSAGISVAVTRNDTRIIVPRGVSNIEDDASRVSCLRLSRPVLGMDSSSVAGLASIERLVMGSLFASYVGRLNEIGSYVSSSFPTVVATSAASLDDSAVSYVCSYV